MHLYSLWQKFVPTLANVYAIGQISIVANSEILKKWSIKVGSFLASFIFISLFSIQLTEWGTWIAEWYHTRLWSLVHCSWAWVWASVTTNCFWTQAQHLRFLHDSIWFIWFDTIICHVILWNRKFKIKKLILKNKPALIPT